MKSNYKELGEYIEQINLRNSDNEELELVGLSISKKFILSIANTIGTDMTKYKIIHRGQFGYGTVTSRNGEKITIALFEDYDRALLSQAYLTFRVIDLNKLLPEYLMMWFSRPEFDRYARFKSHGSARETFDWEEMCKVKLPVPSIEKQREIVKEYNIVQNRIDLNNKLIEKLEETAQTIYKHWFVDFEFPNEEGKPYKSSGGKMVWNEELEKDIPLGWESKTLKYLVTIIDNRGKTPPHLNLKTRFPLIEIGAIRGENRFVDYSKCTKYLKEETYLSWFRSGHPHKKDILFSTVGSIAEIKVFWQEIGTIAQNIVALRTDLNIGLYLFQTLKNIKYELISYDIGSVQASIKVSQIINYYVLLPYKEQTLKFERFAKEITDNIHFYSSENQKLEELKEILLSRLAGGLG